MTYDRYKLRVIKVDSVGQFFKTDGKQQSYYTNMMFLVA